MKKILLTTILFFVWITQLYASELPFKDVKKTDDIYKDLKLLYDNMVIKDNSEHLFNWDSLLKRDEYVAIAVWVWCKECIYPSAEIIYKYDNIPFQDVDKFNPYYYCISIAKDEWLIQWYILDADKKYICQNNQTYLNSKPFCPENNITRIEAATILLRVAKIYNEEIDGKTNRDIEIKDVDNNWYPLAKKAIEIWLISKNSEWKIFPNEFINKNEFVKMAAKIYWINFCPLKTKEWFSSQIKIFDKPNPWSCSWDWKTTQFSDKKTTIYDFYWQTDTPWEYEYSWEFINSITSEKLEANGKCLDNYDLKTNWKWIVKLTIKDKKTWKTSISYDQVIVDNSQDKSKISLIITANPIYWEKELTSLFNSTVSWWEWKISYFWNFDNWSTSQIEDPTNIFTEEWIYIVTLKVIDEKWNTAAAQINIEVIKNLDTDGDWLLDRDDSCPFVFWLIENRWCPYVNEYIATKIENISACIKDRISGKPYIEWKSMCISCPCSINFDFEATLRICDIIFPSITDPLKKTIFSRGSVYEIK